MMDTGLQVMLILIAFGIILMLTITNNQEIQTIKNHSAYAPYAYNPPTQQQIDSQQIKISTKPFNSTGK